MPYPAVGNIVMFLNSAAPDQQPSAAIIAYVHAERCVNLAAFDSSGCAHPRTYVPLIPAGEEPPDGLYAQTIDDYQAERVVANPLLQPQAAVIMKDLPAESVQEHAKKN